MNTSHNPMAAALKRSRGRVALKYAYGLAIPVLIYIFVFWHGGATRRRKSRFAQMPTLILPYSQWDLALVEPDLTEFRRAPNPPMWPTTAYMVTSRSNVEGGRTAHAVGELAKLNITDVRFIFGPTIEDDEVGCKRAKTQPSCRFGLLWGHQQAWRDIAEQGLPSALVVEDDILVHDAIDTLLPLYWSHVPYDFEFVSLGQLSPWIWERTQWTPPTNLTTNGPYTPQSSHAYIINHVSARRFDALLRELFWRHGVVDGSQEDGGQSQPQLTHWHLASDLFLVWQAQKTARDPSKWIYFESTREYPGRWMGAEFLDNSKILSMHKCSCNEEPPAGPDLGACGTFLPIVCQGLVYQHHHCSNMTRLRMWIESWVARHPPTAFPADVYPTPAWHRGSVD